ncbi:MAG: isoprenylcysteine carboxylmethyltransferase family protein [Chloroflexi bacterium]|nr:isoprenylcysteine carboxylmethyltransferase family protein [Chloroflexota bacterium]
MAPGSAVRREAPKRTSPAPGLRAIWPALVAYVRSVEQTPLGGFVLNRLWPAYFFCLVLLAKANSVREVLLDLPARVAERGGWQVGAWLLHQGLTAVFLSLVVGLFIVRKPVVGPRSNLLGAVVALGGTFGLVLVGSLTTSQAPWLLLALGAALIFFGTVFAGVSLLALGTCFGLFPEARGLVTRGPYRWVRHPVYVGELLSGLGLVLPLLSLPSAAAFGLFCGLQYWRALNEERALEAVFPEYAAYRARTWRLVPWVH